MDNNSINNQPITNQPSQPTPPTPPQTDIPTPMPTSDTMTSAPFNTTPPASTTVQISLSIKSLVIAVASILGVVSFFLPWAGVLSYTIDGSQLGSEAYRYMSFFMLMFFTISSTITILNINKKLSQTLKIIISVLGGISAIFALTLMIIVLNELDGYGSVNAGPIVAIIAGIATAITPWLPIKEA